MKTYLLVLSLVCVLSSAAAQWEIDLTELANGYVNPVCIQHRQTTDLYIVEKAGIIRILREDGGKVTEPFLDIRDRVRSVEGEQGLLGLAFSPEYETEGDFYVNYTRRGDGATIISRFRASTDNLEVANPDSEDILLTIDQPFGNHNGGDIAFGPDGYLYISTGDGGAGGDPMDLGQDLMSSLGKMLRIDVRCDVDYCIPEDNPYANDDFAVNEIWSSGLRNVWRFSFDRQTGDMWMADVGQNAREEINLEVAGTPGGSNYGWRCYEGNAEFNLSGCNDQMSYTFPIYDYTHPGNGCSVTGGYVYRGEEYPVMDGAYIYGDFCSGTIWSLAQDDTERYVNRRIAQFAGGEISAFGEDLSGEMYMAAYNQGRIFKISTETVSTREVERSRVTIYPNPVGDFLQVSTDLPSWNYRLVSLQGATVLSGRSSDAGGVDVGEITPGVYLFQWWNGVESGQVKCVIME